VECCVVVGMVVNVVVMWSYCRNLSLAFVVSNS